MEGNITVSCSTAGIVSRLHPAQGVNDIASAGFSGVMLDLSVHYSAEILEELEGDLTEASETERISAHLAQCREKKLKLTAVRTPRLGGDTKRTDLNGLLRSIAEEAVRSCEQAGGRYVIASPLFAGIDRQREWEVNRNYYLALADVCEREETCILLENQCRDLGGHPVRGICSDADVAAGWIEELNQELGMERFGFCMDVGVCNCCGQNMQEMVRRLDSHLKAVILRDNDGYHDSAVLPFTGAGTGGTATDWLSLIRGLRDIQFNGELILDICDSAAMISPLLRPGMLLFAKTAADYLQWQISIENAIKKYSTIVLFGAGNMCRSFMKCYGQKYPPLFTCDNNRQLWGTEICGLNVRPPEELLHLPKDCGVIICNIYYREIKQQLKDMGIRNIAYFNDEYMPSFHFDRLKEG